MRKLIVKNEDLIAQELLNYLHEVERKAQDRLNKSESFPTQQHMIPRFILKQIAAKNPSDSIKGKDLLLKEHRLEFNLSTQEVTDFVTTKQPVSPKKYSIRDKLYNSPFFEHEFLIESMFSIIEGDAVKLIRSKVFENYDPVARELNPFFFSVPSTTLNKPSKIKMRVILSTFFTIQFLRSIKRQEALAIVSANRLGGDYLDYAGHIIQFLASSALQTYLRQWIWVRVPNDELFISELGLTTINTCADNVASMMPVSRRDFVYFSEFPNSHLDLDDKIVYSQSPIIYDWYFSSLLQEIIRWELIDHRNGNLGISFVSNQEATFSTSNIYTPQGCCFGCIFNPVRFDPRNELFIAEKFNDSSGFPSY